MHDVSIIIPAHIRTEQELGWLKECVESARKQDCEIVVYNDGSPIDPYELLTNYPVIYEHGHRKHGAAHARNQAANLATKELILPLDCDDRLVDGAVAKLLSAWDGKVPVYPDISKFGDVYNEHYVLLDFNCDWVYTYVGFSSVNVLHKREYWRTLGGWDTGLEFYEDGEYNSRLFSQWCGKRLPEPLIEYRQHPAQRTNTYKKQASAYSRLILSRSRRLTMACPGCGRKNKAAKVTGANAANAQIASRPMTVEEAIAMSSNMPGEKDGRVLAIYVGGKGLGKHYYQGPGTKYPYKVVHGQQVYVNPLDTEPHAKNGLFHRVEGQVVAPPAPVPAPVPVVQAPEEKEIKSDIVRKSRISPSKREPVSQDMPDVYNLTVKDILNLELDYDDAVAMLQAEEEGKQRKKVIAYLDRIVNP